MTFEDETTTLSRICGENFHLDVAPHPKKVSEIANCYRSIRTKNLSFLIDSYQILGKALACM
jgi:hypothetical protein